MMASAISCRVSVLKYGLSFLAASFLKSGLIALSIARPISSVVLPQWITDIAAARPRCLMPMSIDGIPADGTSTMPLEEFPIENSA